MSERQVSNVFTGFGSRETKALAIHSCLIIINHRESCVGFLIPCVGNKNKVSSLGKKRTFDAHFFLSVQEIAVLHVFLIIYEEFLSLLLYL